jgi:hypothetical protein
MGKSFWAGKHLKLKSSFKPEVEGMEVGAVAEEVEGAVVAAQ